MPLQLISLRDLSPLQVGWMLMPAAIGTMGVLIVGGGWIDRRGPRPLILAGGVLLLVSHTALARLDLHSSYVWISTVMVLQSMGAGLVVLPATVAALDDLPPRYGVRWRWCGRSCARSVARSVSPPSHRSSRADIGGLDPSSASDRPAIQHGFNHVFWVMVGVATIIFVLALPIAATRRDRSVNRYISVRARCSSSSPISSG